MPHPYQNNIFSATTSRGGNKIQFVLVCAIFPTYYEPGRWLPTSTRHQDGLSWNRGQSCRDTLRLSVCYLIFISKSPSEANIDSSSTEDLMSVKQLFEILSLSVFTLFNYQAMMGSKTALTATGCKKVDELNDYIKNKGNIYQCREF